MLRQKEKYFQCHTVSLEQLVPADNFYLVLVANLDLRFVYDLVKDDFAPTLGRPPLIPSPSSNCSSSCSLKAFAPNDN